MADVKQILHLPDAKSDSQQGISVSWYLVLGPRKSMLFQLSQSLTWHLLS